MFIPALHASLARRAGPAWGSEADALYDVETLYFVLDFTIEQFCALSIVEPPTILGRGLWARSLGRPNFVWYKLRQYPIGQGDSFGTNLSSTPFGPDPVLRGVSGAAHYWVASLRNPLRSTPKLLAPPGPSQKLGTKIGGSVYWTSAQVDLPTFFPTPVGFKF